MTTTSDNANRYFKGQLPNEEVLCFTRKHWMVIMPYFVGLGLVFSTIILSMTLINFKELNSFLGDVPYHMLMFLGTTILTYLLHLSFIKILNYYLKTVIVTNMRIIDMNKTLFFCDRKDTIDLGEVQDISMGREGIIHTLFDYGEINITLSASAQTKILHYIPNPNYYFRKIVKTKQAYVSQFMTQNFEAQRIQEAQANELQMAAISAISVGGTCCQGGGCSRREP
ncbi:hypothetical protein KBD59_01770 [Candidatus Gracilibacteria bacterium]|nr:hypothetical protein [Candidatus Gracilibacteria bacterium]